MRRSYCSWCLYCTIYTLIFIFSAQNSFPIEKYSLYCSNSLLIESERIMLAEVGTLETGQNKGDVAKYLKSIGLGAGYSYCAAGQYYSFEQACKNLNLSLSEIPICRTGLARKVFSDAKNRGKNVVAIPERHNLIVWRRRGSSWQGHIERVVKKCRAGWVETVGFNVKFPNGSEGVGIKKRNIFHIIGKLQVVGIVGFHSEANS